MRKCGWHQIISLYLENTLYMKYRILSHKEKKINILGETPSVNFAVFSLYANRHKLEPFSATIRQKANEYTVDP
jgi:hypothetical protein